MRPGSGRFNAFLTVMAVLAVMWGALAFGAVYPWAYVPLACICAGTGIAALFVERGRPPIAAMAGGLAAVGMAVALQLVPLPEGVIDRVSPNADAFFRYSNAAGSHAISVAPERTVLGLGLFAAFALFFVGTTRLLSAASCRGLVRSLVGFGVVLALIGIAQHVLSGGAAEELKIYGFWQPQSHAAPFGPFVNRNHFAGWIIMVLPLALSGAYAAWEVGRGLASGSVRNSISWLSSASAGGMALMGFAAVIMGLALLMSQSRSGMAGFAAGASMLGWVVMRAQPTARSKAAVVACFAVGVIGIGTWAGMDRVAQRVSSVGGDAASVGGRRQAWADTFHVVRDFPFAGSGLNTFGIVMLLYQSDRQLHFQEAHNDYLQVAAEGGLLVGVPALAALMIFVRDVRRRFREAPKHGTTYWLRVGAVVGLISIGLQSCVEFSLQMPGNAALFAALAAIALHQSPNLRLSAVRV